jgi:hypothetical protein
MKRKPRDNHADVLGTIAPEKTTLTKWLKPATKPTNQQSWKASTLAMQLTQKDSA